MPRSVISEGDGDPRHGTRNGYTNLRCRCERCTVAASRYFAGYMPGRGERLGPCEERACGRPQYALGLCKACYERRRRAAA
jgi:hypothetical protein